MQHADIANLRNLARKAIMIPHIRRPTTTASQKKVLLMHAEARRETQNTCCERLVEHNAKKKDQEKDG